MNDSSNDNGDPDLRGSKLEFGFRIIERLEAIRDDIEHEGAQGLISLIGASIARNGYNHKQLLRFGRRICPPGYFDAYRELVDQFKGDDRKRCLWNVQDDGTYALVA